MNQTEDELAKERYDAERKARINSAVRALQGDSVEDTVEAMWKAGRLDRGDDRDYVEAHIRRLILEAQVPLADALGACGVWPDGYCWCGNPQQAQDGHVGECREALVALQLVYPNSRQSAIAEEHK